MRTVSQANERSVPGDRPEAGVDLGDRHRLHLVVSVRGEDRVRGVDGDPHAGELVLVDLVPAALGHRLDQADHLDPRLEGVVTCDQADVSPADDEQALGWPDEVAIDEGLEGARPVDAGEGVPLEAERLLAGPGRDEEDLRRDERVPRSLAEDSDLPVAEHGEGDALKPHVDRLQGTNLPLEEGRDVDPAGSGVDGLDRPEETVGLEDELPAEAVLVVDEEGLTPRFPSSAAAESPAGPPPMMRTGTSTVAGGRIAGASLTRGSSGRPSIGSTRIPGRTGVMHALTGLPFARTRHWAHWPLAQKIPCGAPSLGGGRRFARRSRRGRRRSSRLPLPRGSRRASGRGWSL